MRFLIISHAPHIKTNESLFSYAPYTREMNLWIKYVDEVEVVAPSIKVDPTVIELEYDHNSIQFSRVPLIEFTSFIKGIKSIFKIPIILFTLFKSCKQADHIHLRCPGNIGLLGCFVQILFPKKSKTAKYAGNWDPKATQPKSYKLQKWLLKNTFLTKNMQVLVYGDWKNQTKNIKSFFTATFTNLEIEKPIQRDYAKVLQFVFVGSLVAGKRPLLTIKIIEELIKQEKEVRLNLFGDGVLRTELYDYIANNNLKKYITLHGNQEKEVIKKALKKAHFLILPSKSEGWPKAIAEAMFFGTIPIATKISCVPYMLDYGNRGILIESKLKPAVDNIILELNEVKELQLKAEKAIKWSQYYTLDLFENEIFKLIN